LDSASSNAQAGNEKTKHARNTAVRANNMRFNSLQFPLSCGKRQERKEKCPPLGRSHVIHTKHQREPKGKGAKR
jgi:hypothetical protein